MSQPFPDGTLVQRRLENRYDAWWSGWCKTHKQPLSAVFTVRGRRLEREGLYKYAPAPDLSLFIQVPPLNKSLEDYA